MALFAVALTAIIGLAGLALDMGHVYWNKTRLQNALDAAALSAAKTLNDGMSTDNASAKAVDTFNEHLEGEMAGLTPTFEFSQTLSPFTAGASAPDARFVRARVDSFPTEVYLARVLPGVGASQNIGGSAVAGPSPPLGGGESGEVCNLVPILMCAKEGAPLECNDTTCYGYDVGVSEELCLKLGSPGGGGEGCDNDFPAGSGNFNLLDLGCPGGEVGGGACIRQQLAGKYAGCAEIDETVSVDTAPGDKVGPVEQGINTRFGIYQGAGLDIDGYPPDVVTHNRTDEAGFWFTDYLDRLENTPHDFPPIADGGQGVPKKRVVAVMIGDCSGAGGGVNSIPVLDIACIYLTRPAGHPAGNSPTLTDLGQKLENGEIAGQLIDEGGGCQASGGIAEEPPDSTAATTPYKIILYKDPDSIDS
jgi:Flp pilus assembly protein TadG